MEKHCEKLNTFIWIKMISFSTKHNPLNGKQESVQYNVCLTITRAEGRTAKSHAFAVRLMVLSRISQSHVRSQNSHCVRSHCTYWGIIRIIRIEIRIEKFRINVSLASSSLSFIWHQFKIKVFREVVFHMHRIMFAKKLHFPLLVVYMLR